MNRLREYCLNTNDNMVWHIPQTGLYAYLETRNISSDFLEKKLLDNQVLVSSTSQNYIKGFEHPEGLRLCVCRAQDQDMERAIQMIKSYYPKG